MNWIDWLIVIVPVSFVLWISFYCRRYVRGVADYLAAGRLAGRYVLTVGEMTAALGLINLAMSVERFYSTGFALQFWQIATIMFSTVIALSGFCIYRWRQSKALSNGQFLEMRYSRKFRIVASTIRVVAEMLANSLGPAISAKVFMYLLGIPSVVTIGGFDLLVYPLMVGVMLMLALFVILPGGRIALFVSDAIQGLLCYPIFIVLIAYILIAYSWGNEVVPVLTDRVPGESFLNPFDIENLRDFNIVFVIIMIIGNAYNRASWLGNDNTSAARNPHEQKMAGILSIWKYGVGALMIVLISMAVVTGMNHEKFASKAHEIRQGLSMQVASEVAGSDEELARIEEKVAAIPVLTHKIGVDAPMSQKENLDTVYMNAAQEGLGDTPEGNKIFQKFSATYKQMMLPAAFRRMLPPGLLGLFCLLGVLLMITTDDSRLMNASTAIVQDLVVPLRKTEMTPEKHVRYVRWFTVGVALFFFACSMLLVQLDYIQMFVTILLSLWLGCAGPIMVFGLYSRFGNTIGAYCALIFGSGTAVSGILIQRGWATVVYPFLENHGWVEVVGRFLTWVSSPLNPYVVWEMNPVKPPINSVESYFLAMLFGTIAYILGSVLTNRGKRYNLDRLLHRGKYNIDGIEETKTAWTRKSVWGKLIGITADYTRGDKIIAWSVFGYTFIYQLGFTFLMVLMWNSVTPWSNDWWGRYFFITYLVVTPLIGVITTVWFSWGGIIDIRQLFKDLAKRVDNPLDNGRVEGHVSLAEVELLGKDDDKEDK